VLAALALPGRALAQTLTAIDVNQVISQAAKAAIHYNDKCVIAVSDREGYILGVYYPFGTLPPAVAGGVNLAKINAISKAGASAYLSSNGEAFTTRTAGFIIGPHFPPGVRNVAPGPLTGVGLSSLPFSDINHFRNPANPAAGIANTTLSGNPGGVPLYKDGVLVGAVGVDSSAELDALLLSTGTSKDEEVAMVGQSGFTAPSGIIATNVLLNGIRLAYSLAKGANFGLATISPGVAAPGVPGFDADFPSTDSPGHPFNPTTSVAGTPLSNITGGTIRNQITGSALGPVNGQPRLTAAEVTQILLQGALRAHETRGAIRNPQGVPAEVFVVVVDYYNPDTPPGTVQGQVTVPQTLVPQVLGSIRTNDATIFSYDVAAQKARTALYFSNNQMALSSRTVGFLAQGTYPPGIDGTSPGPYGPPTYGVSNKKFGLPGQPLFPPPRIGFCLQDKYSFSPTGLFGTGDPIPANPGPDPATPGIAPNQFLPNGITVFPGGFPLYRHGQLIGAVGVSGDGVDQDDLISASATVGFEAAPTIRADQFTFRGARLPYAKFPQNASL
jgi:uncharacterized protein GlcG (DUF336 family)